MSKHRLHTSVSSAVTHLVKEISTLSWDEASALHGVYLNEDGSVTDLTYYTTFATLTEWATAAIEQENADYYEELNHETQSKYDDE